MEVEILTKCTNMNKELDLDMPIFANICKLTSYIRQPIFIQIINVLDLFFKGKTFESSTLESLYAIISQMVTDGTNITIFSTESHMWPLNWHMYI